MVKPTEFGITGTPVGSGNRGVDALLAALIELCTASSSNSSPVIFGSRQTLVCTGVKTSAGCIQVPIEGWRLALRTNPRSHLLVIAACALLHRLIPSHSIRSFIERNVPWINRLESTLLIGDIRGGDSFSDIYGLKRFLIATLPVASVIWVKGSIVQFPQTYGPYKSWISRTIARWILRHSNVIVARDKESQAVAQALVGSAKTVKLSPDVAFALHVERLERVEIDGAADQAVPARAIGLNVNGLMYNGGYTKQNMFGLKLDYPAFLARLVPALLEAQDGPILLIPHTYAPAGDVESDNDACLQLKAALPEALSRRVHVLTGEYDCHQLKGIIGQCDFFIGSRMHSCIAALSQAVPCIGVAYSMKFRGVFESVGVADWVLDARIFDNEGCVTEILRRWTQRQEARAVLGTTVPAAQRLLRERFAEIFREGVAPNG